MRILIVATCIALASTVAAMPEFTRVRRDDSLTTTCLSHSDAETILGKFTSVMEHTNVTASNETVQELLADRFFETSNSINLLAGNPIDSTTFPSKVDYIAAILNAPAPRNITTLKLMIADWSQIRWYWRMPIGAQAEPVQGFNLMEIDENHKILGQYIEFNSIAWGIDIGFTVINRMGQRIGQTNASTNPHASAASSVSSTSILSVLVASLFGFWIAHL